MTKQSSITKVKHIVFLRTIINGIFGGLFGGFLLLVMHFFSMTEINSKIILHWMFQNAEWTERWYASVIFLLLISLLSTFIALIYYFLFKTRKSWVTGAFYGIITWVILYYILPVLINNYNPFIHLKSESHVSMFCLFILYGVFTGYSISFDYANLKKEYEQ